MDQRFKCKTVKLLGKKPVRARTRLSFGTKITIHKKKN